MKALLRAQAAWVLCLLLWAGNAWFTPGFTALVWQDGRLVGSLPDLLYHGSTVALLAVCCVPLVAAAGVDLALGALMAWSASVLVVGADHWGAPVGLVLALLVGMCAGGCTGLAIVRLRVSPLLATLVGLSAWRGAAQLTSGGGVHHATEPAVRAWGLWSPLGLPVLVWVTLVVVVVMHLVWTRTTLGLKCTAWGLNARATEWAGVSLLPLGIGIYALSGAAAAVAGCAQACELGAADASNVGIWRELDVLVALVLGGASVSGGRVSVCATVGGALAAETLVMTLAWQGASTSTALFVRAAVLVGVLAWRAAPKGTVR
jgi:ribose/xylose/arabinose/galactoside ABC-type transport system permease subunit